MKNNTAYKLIPASEKKGEDFVGIRIADNMIEFHYPETYRLSDDKKERRKDIVKILSTIKLAKAGRPESKYYTKNEDDDGFPLNAYLWIINDYLKYGRYENRETIYTVNGGGKINWKRTISAQPIISNGNFIYSELISERRVHRDDLITEIYNFCVKKAVDSVGWIYGINFDGAGVDYDRLYNKKRYLIALNKEISRTFIDTKRYRLQQMKNIITGLDDELQTTQELTYGVFGYDHVFECMVDRLFSTVTNIADFYPCAEYRLVMSPHRCKTVPLRPDTIMTKERTAYILDSKYYRYGITFDPSDLPDTTSIQKQITYGDYVKAAKEDAFDSVYNAFVLPYSKKDNPCSDMFSGDMVFAGYAQADWSVKYPHSKIAVFLIDTTFLIEHWTKHNKEISLQLMNEIEKHIGALS